MRSLQGRVALLTGASRGIGVHIARALADEGVSMALVARSGPALEAVAEELRRDNIRVVCLPTDLSQPDAVHQLPSRVEAALGPIDILVNNAGIETICDFATADPADLQRAVHVNLMAPLLLSRAVLPQMRARGWGHLIHMASMAGLGPTAFGVAYGATKHGVVGMGRAQRATEQALGSPVGVSVICPGFVSSSGIYANLARDHGAQAPPLMGTSPPEAVARAVVRAILHNHPEVIVNPGVPRLLIAFNTLFPKLGGWLAHKTGMHRVFQAAAQDRA